MYPNRSQEAFRRSDRRRKLGMTRGVSRGLSSVTGGHAISSKELSGGTGPAWRRQKGGLSHDGDRSRRSKAYEMHDLGIVRNRSDQAIETYIRRITRAQKIEWCSVEQLQLVIETLKNWVDRIEEPAAREHLQRFFSEQQPATAVMQ
ncbi:MAG: phage protein GemA/Gp16 family protein [Bilophila wadsworthia]